MDRGSWDNNPLGGGEGRGGPHLTSPKGAKQFFRPEDAPLYLERGNYEQTNNKQTCKRSQRKGFFLLLKNLLVALMKRLASTKVCKCRIDQ
jgi:hypothetical protein